MGACESNAQEEEEEEKGKLYIRTRVYAQVLYKERETAARWEKETTER